MKELTSATKKKHVYILDFLRGIAALMVVLFHYDMPTLHPHPFSDVIKFGSYGVHVFFVISGFIIPYSMYWNNYRLNDYFKNLFRRFVRIDPPSYVSLVISFALYYSAIVIVHRPIRGAIWPGINFESIVGNLTYSAPYLNTTWFNPVFWTLAIEFQFYILIGLLLPLFLRKNEVITSAVLLVTLLLGYVDFFWFFEQSAFFILGLLIFMQREKLMNNKLILLFYSLTVIALFTQNKPAEIIFAMAAFLIILSGVDFRFRFTTFLGKISYSLYITHFALGLMAEIILKRLIPIHVYPWGKVVMYFIYVAIAIGFAAIFYRYVERPFLRLSKKIKLSREPVKNIDL